MGVLEKEQTRIILNNAMVNILLKKHYDNITIKEIAGATKINRSTYYYYFNNIREQLNNITERFINKLDNFIIKEILKMDINTFISNNKKILLKNYPIIIMHV